MNSIAAALEVAEKLDVDELSELVSVLSRRLAERGRERVAEVVAQSHREFNAGQCKVVTPGELIQESRI